MQLREEILNFPLDRPDSCFIGDSPGVCFFAEVPTYLRFIKALVCRIPISLDRILNIEAAL